MNKDDIKKIFLVMLSSFLIWLVYTTNHNQHRLTALEQWKHHIDRSLVKLWDQELNE